MLAARVNLSRLRARLAYRWLALTGTLLCAVALLLLATACSQIMLLGAAGFMGVGWGLFFPSLLALSTQEDGAGGVRQVAVFDSVYDLSFFVGQFAFGLLISAAGYRLSFGVSVLVCLASTASLLWSARRLRANQAQGGGVHPLQESA
jgi:predicted MFS family arabinose efflux permease